MKHIREISLGVYLAIFLIRVVGSMTSIGVIGPLLMLILISISPFLLISTVYAHIRGYIKGKIHTAVIVLVLIQPSAIAIFMLVSKLTGIS